MFLVLSLGGRSEAARAGVCVSRSQARVRGAGDVGVGYLLTVELADARVYSYHRW
jgi:hypothetical protein